MDPKFWVYQNFINRKEYISNFVKTKTVGCETVYSEWFRVWKTGYPLQVTLILPIKFRVNWPSVLKKFKIDFQDGGHIEFLIRINFASFDLQLTQILPTKFRVSWPFGA